MPRENVWIYMPYILPDEMSEAMTNFVTVGVTRSFFSEQGTVRVCFLHSSLHILWFDICIDWQGKNKWQDSTLCILPLGRAKLKNKVGQRTQKQDGTQHAFFWKCCGVGSCALDEIDVRSSLKHRAHWWYQGPQFTTACCVSYVYILLVAIAANVINFIPSF